jgi:hypothetical protein
VTFISDDACLITLRKGLLSNLVRMEGYIGCEWDRMGCLELQVCMNVRPCLDILDRVAGLYGECLRQSWQE